MSRITRNYLCLGLAPLVIALFASLTGCKSFQSVATPFYDRSYDDDDERFTVKFLTDSDMENEYALIKRKDLTSASTSEDTGSCATLKDCYEATFNTVKNKSLFGSEALQPLVEQATKLALEQAKSLAIAESDRHEVSTSKEVVCDDFSVLIDPTRVTFDFRYRGIEIIRKSQYADKLYANRPATRIVYGFYPVNDGCVLCFAPIYAEFRTTKAKMCKAQLSSCLPLFWYQFAMANYSGSAQVNPIVSVSEFSSNVNEMKEQVVARIDDGPYAFKVSDSWFDWTLFGLEVYKPLQNPNWETARNIIEYPVWFFSFTAVDRGWIMKIGEEENFVTIYRPARKIRDNVAGKYYVDKLMNGSGSAGKAKSYCFNLSENTSEVKSAPLDDGRDSGKTDTDNNSDFVEKIAYKEFEQPVAMFKAILPTRIIKDKKEKLTSFRGKGCCKVVVSQNEIDKSYTKEGIARLVEQIKENEDDWSKKAGQVVINYFSDSESKNDALKTN